MVPPPPPPPTSLLPLPPQLIPSLPPWDVGEICACQIEDIWPCFDVEQVLYDNATQVVEKQYDRTIKMEARGTSSKRHMREFRR
jgi:hypothetical protein